MSSARTVRLPGPILGVVVALVLPACENDSTRTADPGATISRTAAAPMPLFTCRGGVAPRLRPASPVPVPATAERIAATLAMDAAAASAARAAMQKGDFDDFLHSVWRECGPDGKYLVDGDVAIGNVKLLREFFVQPLGDVDAWWNAEHRRELTYCVSTAFAGSHDRVVADMEAATGAWAQAADIHFIHAGTEDATCDARNDAVLFDVNPVDVDGAYLARGFSPGELRAGRNLYVDLDALNFDTRQALQLDGVLRHAVGHILGFRHDQPRPVAGARFDDPGFIPLADYDAIPVMRYPQCNGGTDWKRLLTDRDRSTVACAYGAAPAFVIDPRVCKPRGPPRPLTHFGQDGVHDRVRDLAL